MENKEIKTFHNLETAYANLSWLVVGKGGTSFRVNDFELGVPYYSPARPRFCLERLLRKC